MRGMHSTVVVSGLTVALAFAGCGGGSSSSLVSGDDGGSGGSSSGGGSGGGAEGGSGADGGGATGVGPDGGTVSQLAFAVVGDTRPANADDVAGYPTAIITKIYQDIEALTPHPPFVLSTGDYQFSSSYQGSTAAQQMQIYMGARAKYSGTWFPAMGNHECTGATASNCVQGQDGTGTAQFAAFHSTMLAPIQKTLPYYSFNVSAPDGSWTAKFVVTAANAWDSAQQTWLEQTMAQSTTYTFVTRHESSSTTNGPPGIAGVDAVLASHPYTLKIVGHSHTYENTRYNPQEVVLGNGGAPLSSSSKNYGFGTFVQRADGAIICDEVDYMSGQPDPSYHFVIKADGTLTQ